MQAHGLAGRVGTGDIVLVRTGQLARAKRAGWNDYAGGAAPGLSFTTADWLHRTEIAAIATDTWGFEVRPNEFDEAFQPLHQVAIPNMGLFPRRDVGPRRTRRGLRARRHLRVLSRRRTVAGHRCRGRTGQSDRGQVTGVEVSLVGKVAVITGNGKWPGREAALRFADEGTGVRV